MQNFFIVGAQKAGTTALHSFLGRHSQISMSIAKEIHFFDNDALDWSSPPYESLEDKMSQKASARIRGEATPIYMYWPNSIERLYRYDPHAKIIVLLRHPVHRAHSQWRMEIKRQSETLPFSEAIRPAGRRRVADAPGGVHRLFSYVERSLYVPQIYRLLQYFPRQQIHFAKTDDLWGSPRASLETIEDFLGVRHEIDPAPEYIISASTSIPAFIDSDSRHYLNRLFADDITETAYLSGLNLSEWLEPEFAEVEKALP